MYVLGCKIILPLFYCLCKHHHSPTMNYTNNTKTIQNQKLLKIQNFHSHKLCIHNITLVQDEGVLQGHKTPPYILTKRKLIKKLPKTYPPQGSPNNQKEQNHKKTTSHGSPCDSTINHKKTTSHGSPCDSTINHNKCTWHKSMHHDPLWNPIPHLNIYPSNCVIKLHNKLQIYRYL